MDIPKDEAISMYDIAPKRVSDQITWWSTLLGDACDILFEETKLEVFIDGAWLDVCRTDKSDDVATTTIEVLGEKEIINKYRNAIRLGARVTDGSFRCIDSMSDG